MKRILYRIIPKPLIEIIKLNYYNFKISNYKFGLKTNSYSTQKKNEWQVFTTKPLYFIVRDIDRYEKYYNVKLNDVVIDGGANEGLLSVIYSQKAGAKGSVYAFEPDSKNIKTFMLNFILNAKNENLKLVNKGLWHKNGRIDFYEDGTVGSSVFYANKNSEKVIIETTSIDNFLESKNIKQLNFIKMDIEGAEIEALKGSIKTIENFKPQFAIASYHLINNDPTYKALEVFFDKINYPYKTEFFNDGEIITYAGDSVKNNIK